MSKNKIDFNIIIIALAIVVAIVSLQIVLITIGNAQILGWGWSLVMSTLGSYFFWFGIDTIYAELKPRMTTMSLYSYEDDLDGLSKLVDACKTEAELEELYNKELAGKKVNVVDELLIREMFLDRSESISKHRKRST